jgi:hypothetical protein
MLEAGQSDDVLRMQGNHGEISRLHEVLLFLLSETSLARIKIILLFISGCVLLSACHSLSVPCRD